jgi:uncharacterized phage-associated protein
VTAMYNLTFDFSIEKLVQSIAFFSMAGIRDLTKLKAAKLLYFADKTHLLNYGQPIIGDVYWCMDYGPVPSFALNEMSAAIGGPEVAVGPDSDASRFTEVLIVRRALFHRHPRFQVRNEAYNPSVFSASELNALDVTVRAYGNKTAAELVDLTHREPTWIIANQGRESGGRAPITYDLFFRGAPEKSQRFLAKLVAEQLGVAIELAGDADYRAFANELMAYDFTPEEICESDVRRPIPYSRA